MMEEKRKLSSEKVKAEALRLGFSACGMARAEMVDKSTAGFFRQWLSQGNHAEMHYMENHLEKRLDPRQLLEGAKTVVCVALNYAPGKRFPDGEYQLADYALGQDYHDIMRQKLHQLAETILSPLYFEPDGESPETQGDNLQTVPYRAFADTAPILERYWAEKAGLGWMGRNHQLIIPPSDGESSGGGSMFFLGELLLNVESDHYDTPLKNRCGNCTRCIDACPTGALAHPVFNAGRCLSYQTIENRGKIPSDLVKLMGDTIYGCDRCQRACPWNRFARPNGEPLLQPKTELLSMTSEQWEHLTPDDYRRLFKGSAVKRAKYEGLMRNIRAVSQEKQLNHSGDAES